MYIHIISLTLLVIGIGIQAGVGASSQVDPNEKVWLRLRNPPESDKEACGRLFNENYRDFLRRHAVTQDWDLDEEEGRDGIEENSTLIDEGPMDENLSYELTSIRRWTHGVVPVDIGEPLSIQESEKLSCAFLFFHERTCVRFRKRRPRDTSYIKLRKNHVLHRKTDMDHTSQPTGQGSSTAQATAEDDTTAQATAEDDTTAQATAEDDTTAQATAEDDTTAQATAADDTTAQATAADDSTAQATAADDNTETRDWLTSQEFDAMFGAGAGDAVPAQQIPLPLSHFFTVTNSQSIRVKKFGVQGHSFKVQFRNIDQVDDVEDLLKDVLGYLVDKVTDESTPGTLLGVSIDHPSMDSPFLIPFAPVHVVTPEVILRTIMKILQSNKDVALDSEFEMKFTTVTPPSGSGDGKRKYRNNWEEWKKAHTTRGGCFITINNKDDLCCARALVVAKAKVDQDPRFNIIRQDETTRHHEQRRRAVELMKDAGLEHHQGSCGVPELKAIQEVLSPDYQIKVFWKEGFNQIIFKGPAAPNILCLYLYDKHYDIITSVPAFFDESFYCHACDVAYHRKNSHRCQESCKACYEPRVCIGDVIHCQDCNRYFRGQECYDTHRIVIITRGNKRERRESSVCNRVKRCPVCCSQYNVNRGQHKCGKFWCPSCSAWVEKKGHSCHIQPLKPSEPKHETLIFFDFETSQEVEETEDEESQLRIHKVNACVVQKVCTLCRDQPLGQCGRCGQNEMTFDGPDTLENFCRWLFSEANRGSVALAHNSQAFDSQFILNYLHRQAVKPQVITRGLKILSLSVNGLKIIDSLSFLPMPLSALPKAFNLTELKKGYFPHLFNTAENWDYTGPMPDASFYDPANMKPGPRASFEAWYEENKNNYFDFKKELMEYCKSDVDILRKACLSFQKAFFVQTKVNPFESAITIAQACQFVYRQNFLKPDTIALIPHGGYRWKDRFSVTAIKWLKWKSHVDNIQIRHALNGGEVKVGRFKVDGMAGNRVFEFHGCQFHGCPTCFTDRSLKLPLAELTAEDAYTRTMDRRLYIESQGYTVEELWGCQLEEELRHNIEMRDFFKTIAIIDPMDPREAFYGGRTNAVTLYYKAKPDEKINYADVCSLYPYICKYGKFPTGHPTIITEGFEPIERKPYEGLIKCRVLPPRKLLLPVLPYRFEGKLLFPLCRTCLETRQTDTCQHSDDERVLEGAWVSEELYKAMDLGYRVVKVHEVWDYPTVMQYDGEEVKDTLFGEYINSFLKLKTEASGWPKWCKSDEDKDSFIKAFEEKEKIKLEPAKMERNEAYRALAKLMLNSFWGKFAQGDNLSKSEYFLEPAKFFDLVLNPSNVISTIKPINTDLVLVNYTKEENFIRTQSNTSVVVAAYVTAQARLKLYSFLERIPERVMYMDTDSVVYVTRPGDTYDLPTGSFMGDLTDELADYGPGSYISEFVSGGPKNYAFKVVTPGKEQPSFVTKVRGFTLTSDVSNILNFETLKMKVQAFVKSDCPEKVKIYMRKINRKEDHSVVTEYVSKTYQVVYDKRVVKHDFSTLPYGY